MFYPAAGTGHGIFREMSLRHLAVDNPSTENIG